MDKFKKAFPYLFALIVAFGILQGIHSMIAQGRRSIDAQLEELSEHPEKLIAHANDVIGPVLQVGVEVADRQMGLTLEEERDIGDLLYKQALEEEAIVLHPAQQARIDMLLAYFLKERKESILNFTINIVDSEVENAYATLGGHLYVTTAMLDMIGADNNALAFIIGHEVGHVVNGHCAKSWLPRVRGWEMAGNLGRDIGSLLSYSIKPGYSELQEYQADLWSYLVLRKIGVDKDGSLAGTRLLIKLDQKYQAQAQSEPQQHRRPVAMDGREQRIAEAIALEMEKYWASHPPSQERHDRLEKQG